MSQIRVEGRDQEFFAMQGSKKETSCSLLDKVILFVAGVGALTNAYGAYLCLEEIDKNRFQKVETAVFSCASLVSGCVFFKAYSLLLKK